MAAELAPSLVLPQKDTTLNAPLITRRRLALLAGGLAAGLLAPRIAAARFPERPVRIIVGFAAGGTVDTIARLLAQALSPLLGQQVIVENRPGASASLAASAVVRSEADGHTLLFGVFSHAVAPALAHLTYDTLADLTAVSQVASVPLLMFAAGNAPFRTVADVVAAAKARPQTITYASHARASRRWRSSRWRPIRRHSAPSSAPR
jgi:tripartite-type tricarboxylate transporter receptor subunit TctC